MPGPSPGKTWALLMAALLLLGASYSASKPRAGRLRQSLMVGASTFLRAEGHCCFTFSLLIDSGHLGQ